MNKEALNPFDYAKKIYDICRERSECGADNPCIFLNEYDLSCMVGEPYNWKLLYSGEENKIPIENIKRIIGNKLCEGCDIGIYIDTCPKKSCIFKKTYDEMCKHLEKADRE